MREYYIRREGDEDASGPFDIDQISSLIEADKLDASAYYYEIETESWVLISSNQELMDTLFPKKRKLSLRTPEAEAESKRQAEEAAKAAAAQAKAEQAAAEGEAGEGGEPSSEADGESAKPAEAKEEAPKKKKKEPEEEPRRKLEVTSMLAQAEGRADDPSGKSPREKQAAVAYFGLRLLALLFLSSILAMAFIEQDLLMTADAIAMSKSPYLLIAAFDLILLLTLLLHVTEIYPLVRFRAAIGAGLLTLLFYSSGDTIPLISNLLIMVAIYFSSAIIKIRYLIACAVTGFAGVFGYVYAFFLS